MIPPRIAVDRQTISDVVAAFYAQVRRHPVLGPVFAAHVTDWPSHEDKITRFWANALLYEKSYDGNPMQVHLRAGNVRAAHFATWLDLFEATLQAEVPSPQAEQWAALARRIGRGLAMGVADHHRQADAVPDLSRLT